MKSLFLMVVLTLVGTLGCLVRPFYGIAVYYIFAVLRPQYIWRWSLPQDVQWSRLVALAAMGATLLMGSKSRPSATLPGLHEPRLGCSHLLFLLNFIWIGLAYFTAINREVAFPYFMEYVKIYFMMALVTFITRSATDLWTLLIVIGLTIAYIALEVNSIYLSFGSIGIARDGYGGLDNNGAGLMLAMGVPICLVAWDTVRSRWRWLFLALLPAILHAVLMTFSRGAMVSLIVTAPLILIRSRHRVQLGILGLALVVVLIPLLAGPQIRARFLSINEHQVDDSANSRKDSWKAAWKITMDYPIHGVGIRNANLLSRLYGADEEGRTIHNTYLQISADTGLCGIGLYLAMFGSVWFDTRRVRRFCQTQNNPVAERLYGVAYGVETSMTVFCIGAIFLSLENFELPFLLLLLGSQAGALARGGQRLAAFKNLTPHSI